MGSYISYLVQINMNFYVNVYAVLTNRGGGYLSIKSNTLYFQFFAVHF